MFGDGVRVACHLYPTADAPMAGEVGRGHSTRAIDVIGADVTDGVATIEDAAEGIPTSVAGGDGPTSPTASDAEPETAP
jgi:hypothetical protein